MALYSGLPERYGSLISELEALGDERQFTSEFVKKVFLKKNCAVINGVNIP